MATYEVTVSRSGSTVVTSWSPSPTGAGLPANKYQFSSGDMLACLGASWLSPLALGYWLKPHFTPGLAMLDF